MGQCFRSLAMIHASSNFSHQIATEKKPTHTLVTSGVYALVRHPSYFGFFWWSVGTQIFLANPLSTMVFVAVLWRFFSSRIRYYTLNSLVNDRQEEVLLVKFFDEEYIDYHKKVGTWIPFIP
jgi:protein-S-isoprenylcysteine O-methyltransferase